jgi:hypothetical protein
MSIPPATFRPPQEAVVLELNRRRRKLIWRPCRHAGKSRAFSEAGAVSHVIVAVAALCPVECPSLSCRGKMRDAVVPQGECEPRISDLPESPLRLRRPFPQMPRNPRVVVNAAPQWIRLHRLAVRCRLPGRIGPHKNRPVPQLHVKLHQHQLTHHELHAHRLQIPKNERALA